ncbi:MAG: aminopeptidase P family protein [Acidobacteria bacterium]|nr:aminopeptidase P family protein [Acidobacteriota bacterium]
MRVRTVIPALLCLGAVASVWVVSSGAATSRAAEPPVIRAAPAAPVFRDGERHAELRARRERVAAKLGPNALLVLFSAEPRVYTNDVDYEFRQENNLYYLTALRQKGATLVMLTGARGEPREILFLPRRNPATETWDGRMYSPEEARAVSGVGEIWEARQFEPFMAAVRARRTFVSAPGAVLLTSESAAGAAQALESLYAAMAKNEATLYLLLNGEHDREYAREQAFAAAWAGANSAGLSVRSAWNAFAELRMRKSPYELRLLQHAVDISIEGHQRAQAVAGRSRWEYEVEAELDYTYKRRNADNWGYPSIVGCGPNGTTLHYQESQGRVRAGDLLLMDAGAEYEHYSADVTRTFPVSGKFTPAQAEVYNVVLAAQEAAFRVIKPGAELSDVHNAATEVIKDGLLRLGLITERESLQYRVWYMHGTSHWLGMNVHDVSVRGAKLDAGMVFTVEPGIYVRPDALDNLPKTAENEKFIAAVRPAFEKYKSIGVRIEDDVVVTAEGFRNLSAALSRTVADVEAFIARARKEVRVGLLLPRRWRESV